MDIMLLTGLAFCGLLFWLMDGDDDGGDQGSSDNSVRLTDGDDVYVGNDANETVNAFGGNDDVAGNGGTDILKMGDGNDLAAGGAETDFITGAAGSDVLNGGMGDDVVNAGSGNDIIGSSADFLTEFQNDGGRIWLGQSQIDRAMGFLGRDGLSDEGDDTLSGGAGNDVITDFSGDNLIRGGTGMDVISALDLDDTGGLGVDTLDGGFGKDLLQGDDGDIMKGGANLDAFHVISQSATDRAVEIDDFETGESLLIETRHDSDSDVLTLTLEGTDAKIMLGDQVMAVVHNINDAQDLADLKQGIVFKNTGKGIDGEDHIPAFSDNDDVWNGTTFDETADLLGGNDTADGGGGNDNIDLGNGDDFGRGSFGDDTVVGGAGADVINGGAGNDALNGGTESDVMTSSLDYFDAHSGDLDLTAAQIAEMRGYIEADGMDDLGNDTLSGGDGDDLLTDFAGDNLIEGDLGDDVLSATDQGTDAGAGVDTLIGGAGSDWLEGDDGDILTGGADNDAFNILYSAATQRAVEITDFTAGETIRVVIPDAPAGASLSFDQSGDDVQVSHDGNLVAVVSSAQVAAVQAATTLA